MNKELVKRQNDFVNQITATARDKVNNNAHVKAEITTYSDSTQTTVTSTRTIVFDAPQNAAEVAMQATLKRQADLEKEISSLKETMAKLMAEKK